MVHPWHRVHITNRDLVELEVIHTEPHGPVRLEYENDREGPLRF